MLINHTAPRSEEISLAELKAAISTGRGREVISERDELEFTLSTGERVVAVCARIIENKELGSGSAEFVFKNCLAERWQMNKTATNKGGYFKSEMRRHILEDVYPTLPPELVDVLDLKDITEEIDGETVTYSDALYIPSATDVFGVDADEWYLDLNHNGQASIFATERERVKEIDGVTANWWLRSPLASNPSYFVIVSTSGRVNYYGAYYSFGVAPGFCV